MDKLALLLSIVLLVLAIRFHVTSQVHVKTKIEKAWYDRLFSGNRSPKDNLTEEGLSYRNKSNIYAICGFVVLALYVVLRSMAI